uniref:Uncharacterized protein n=1 Tax=Glossina pallidipes TaxID=7398 RepID=A0A1B0AC36_GLOPL
MATAADPVLRCEPTNSCRQPRRGVRVELAHCILYISSIVRDDKRQLSSITGQPPNDFKIVFSRSSAFFRICTEYMKHDSRSLMSNFKEASLSKSYQIKNGLQRNESLKCLKSNHKEN